LLAHRAKQRCCLKRTAHRLVGRQGCLPTKLIDMTSTRPLRSTLACTLDVGPWAAPQVRVGRRRSAGAGSPVALWLGLRPRQKQRAPCLNPTLNYHLASPCAATHPSTTCVRTTFAPILRADPDRSAQLPFDCLLMSPRSSSAAVPTVQPLRECQPVKNRPG